MSNYTARMIGLLLLLDPEELCIEIAEELDDGHEIEDVIEAIEISAKYSNPQNMH